ncbi:MAG: secretin N-terminal domain-containing protein [Litorimonas sp.]
MNKIIATLMAATLLNTATVSYKTHAQETHVITMQQADIRSFIDDVAIVTGKTFIVDQRVNGQVTISSEQSLSKAEVFTVFKDVMRVHGYAVTRSGNGEYRISQLQGAAADAPFVETFGASGQLTTTVLRLRHGDAAAAARLIKPTLHPQGVLTANPNGSLIVITDFPENIRKARSIIEALDVDSRVLRTVKLSNMRAVDAEDAMKALGGAQPKYKVISVPGSNSLILEGEASEISRLVPILEQMDVPGAIDRGPVSVVPLRFADGASVIEILTTLLPTYAKDGEAAPGVAYEPTSNTIIISASPAVQESMEGVIRQLDVRRPQVLVEAMVVEISDTVTKALGVEFAVGGIEGSAIPFFGTNFNQQPGNVLALTGALVGEQAGLDTQAAQTAAINGLLGLPGTVLGGGVQSGNVVFSAIANAIATDENSNILSTPFVTTLDNEPASFLVGQEIPIATGESLGSDNGNSFRTFERQEVGIKLDILPQISEGDVIRLELKQEVSSIAGALSTLAEDFVTNTREIETTVLANDGEIIVLGGLVQDDEQIDFEKVPILGDAPLIGNLFKSESKSRVRTNLMVFIRPTIIRNGADARPVTQERLQYLRDEDLRQSGRSSSKIDDLIEPYK